MRGAFPRPLQGTRDPAVRFLHQQVEERITGVTGTTLTLENVPIPSTLRLFKNMVLVDLDDATVGSVNGRTITLARAAVSGDVYVAMYYYRQSVT